MAKSSNTLSNAKGLGLLGSAAAAAVVAVVVVLPGAVVLAEAGAVKLNGLLVTVGLPSSFLSLSAPNENLGIVAVIVVEEDEEAVASDVGVLKLNVGAVLDGVAVDVAGLVVDPNVKEGVAVADFPLSSDA